MAVKFSSGVLASAIAKRKFIVTDLFSQISNLATEKNNPLTANIDELSILETIALINSEDKKVAKAVEMELPSIAVAVEKIVESFAKGGRLVYVGAGTSGRLGIVDASECPPTFGADPTLVQAIIAGGEQAIFRAIEGAEDSRELGAREIDMKQVTNNDVVCGIAASGRTPFVLGALQEATSREAFTILVTTNSRENLQTLNIIADCIIAPQVGPEVLAGSTRMKSGTAQKMVLNMLTTASMIHSGKSFGNIMVDVQIKNAKLRERAIKIVMDCTELDYQTSSKLLEEAEGNVKTALVMFFKDVSLDEAKRLLQSSKGFVKRTLK